MYGSGSTYAVVYLLTIWYGTIPMAFRRDRGEGRKRKRLCGRRSSKVAVMGRGRLRLGGSKVPPLEMRVRALVSAKLELDDTRILVRVLFKRGLILYFLVCPCAPHIRHKDRKMFLVRWWWSSGRRPSAQLLVSYLSSANLDPP